MTALLGELKAVINLGIYDLIRKTCMEFWQTGLFYVLKLFLRRTQIILLALVVLFL